MKWAIYNDKQINFCKLLTKINRGKNIGIFWGGKDRKKKSYPTLLRKITLSDRIDHIQTFRTVNKCKQKSGCTVCFKKPYRNPVYMHWISVRFYYWRYKEVNFNTNKYICTICTQHHMQTIQNQV